MTMGFGAGDSTRFVDAKIVQKRTFLHLEPEHDTADDCALLKLGRRRSLSDTFVDYSFETESEENSTTIDSAKSSPRSGPSNQLSGSDDECYAASSHVADSESVDTDDEDVMLEKPNRFTEPTVVGAGGVHQVAQNSSLQHEQFYYYIAVPACRMAVGQSNMFMYTQPATQAMQWEAHAAELRAEAARLTTHALQCEAVAQPIKLQAPPGNYWSQTKPLWQGDSTTAQTTLMLRNIPNDYTRAMLLELLECVGLAGKYDFVYLPIDFDRMASLGYGFVNFVSHADAELARLRLQGFNQWTIQSQKVCEVRWGEPLQGLEAHIERYRSSPVMHRDVPDEFKPIMLKDGVRVAFPAPTRRVRAPRSNKA